MKKYGLLFDLEYCVGCKTCCVACQQENGFDGDSCGIFINEHIYKKTMAGYKWIICLFRRSSVICVKSGYPAALIRARRVSSTVPPRA